MYSAYTQGSRRPFRTSHSVAAAVVAVLVLISVSGIQAASSCPSAPRYSDARYDDDFSYLRDPSCRNDLWDPLKYIPLNSRRDWYLSLGGEIRERYERFHNPLWGQQPQSPGGYLLQRYFLFGDLHLGENLRIFSELMSDWENDRVGGPRPMIDEDQLDFTQFFVDLKLHPFGSDTSLTLRVGRQWLIYGSQRLISNRYGPNVPLPFDGVKAILDCSALARRCVRDQAGRNQSRRLRRPVSSALMVLGNLRCTTAFVHRWRQHRPLLFGDSQ